MTEGKVKMAQPEHQVLLEELTALLRKHTAVLPAVEVLAVAANMVGKIIALQDQRTMTVPLAMEIVSKNIERGNAEAFKQFAEVPGGKA